MTDYNDLAQRIVAQGIGQYDQYNKILPYLAPESTSWDDAQGFCNDGRVVLALMEKAKSIAVFYDDTKKKWCAVHDASRAENAYYAGWEDAVNDSLAIAIVLACLDALEKDNDK